jgi:hypothetical protein
MNVIVDLGDSKIEKLYSEYKAAKEKLLSALLHEEIKITQRKTVSGD